MSVKRLRAPSKIKSPWDRYEIAWIVKLQLQPTVSFEKDTKRAITHEPAVITCTQLATFNQRARYPWNDASGPVVFTLFELATCC